jgi:ribosomal protein S18 acetylase RimI-like enzyme
MITSKGMQMYFINTGDFETVKSKYIDVIENTPDIEKYARWIYGKHPTDEMIKTYIENKELYLLMDGESIAGMTALVMHQDNDYKNIVWDIGLENTEVSTLHILAVCPEYRGRKLGRKILEETIKLSRQNGKKAVRLDVLRSNVPAQRMYEESGFKYKGIQRLYAENTGWTDFLYYEKIL